MLTLLLESGDDRPLAITEFTIFSICPFCKGLTPKGPEEKKECWQCGPGREKLMLEASKIYKKRCLKDASERRHKERPCLICGQRHEA